MVNAVQAVIALALIFILPGYFLVKAVFPRTRLGGDFHAVTVGFLSVTMSVVITILVGTLLGFLPVPDGWERGFFQGAATGAPVIEGTLAAVTLVLGAVAVLRGAFPRVYASRSPPDAQDADADPDDHLPRALAHRADAWRARRDDRAAEAADSERAAADEEAAARERNFGP